MVNTAIIGLGSNIQPYANIKKALDLISRQFPIASKSRFQRTKPIGMKGTPDFLNGAVLIHCPVASDSLKRELKTIELALGRPRKHSACAARTIDLDILVFNGVILDRKSFRRSFVRQSIKELMPGWM